MVFVAPQRILNAKRTLIERKVNALRTQSERNCGWTDFFHSGVLFVTPLSKSLTITQRSDNYHSSGVPGIHILYIVFVFSVSYRSPWFSSTKHGEKDIEHRTLHNTSLFNVSHVSFVWRGETFAAQTVLLNAPELCHAQLEKRGPDRRKDPVRPERRSMNSVRS